MAAKDPVVDALGKASKGLLFPSESEAPFEPFAWAGADPLTSKTIVKMSGAETGADVEETTLVDLFRTVPAADKKPFDMLQKTLQAQLSGIKVFKIGDEAEKQVYIVGKTADGRWAGLQTSVVET